MVCPVVQVSALLAGAVPGGGKEKLSSWKADPKKGARPAYHLLNPCKLDGHLWAHLVADFGDAFSIPLDYAQQLASAVPRVRLLPPYREQLSQIFARFYM